MLHAWIFDSLAGTRNFITPAKVGAVIMALFSLSIQVMFSAVWNLYKNLIPIGADVVGSLILGAIGGGAIAAVLGAMQKNQES